MNLTRQSGKICSNIRFLAIHRSLQIKLFGELKQDKGYFDSTLSIVNEIKSKLTYHTCLSRGSEELNYGK